MISKENKSYTIYAPNDSKKIVRAFNCFEWMPARLVLYLLCLSGISVTYIMRIAINFTILAMVKEKPVVENFNRSETLCYVTDNTTTATIFLISSIEYFNFLSSFLVFLVLNFTLFIWSLLKLEILGCRGSVFPGTICVTLIVFTILSNTLFSHIIFVHAANYTDYGGTLDWSIDVQYYILTSFYWMYIVSQIFGGIAAQKFGTKKVFGWSLFIASFCNLCTPVCSNIHYVIVIILQLIHGFAQGFTWPATYAVISHWIPIQERGRFVTCFQGMALGSTLVSLMSGFIIAKIGWIYVFYTIGSIGLLCTLLWYLLVYDKPELHPRISQQELYYIQKNREQLVHSGKQIPWVSILTSRPVWAIGITSFGRMWVSSIISVYGPLYLKTIIGLKVEMNGVLLGVSSFSAFLSTLFYSFISDKLVTHKVVSLKFNRQLFSAIGQVIPGILAIVMGYLNCNIPLVLTCWVLIHVFITSSFSGAMANIVDVSPSYTAPVSSFVQVILLLPTVLSTLVVKTLLQKENTLQAWRTIFCISSGVIISTYVFYAIFASAKVQKWDLSNTPKTELLNNKALELRKMAY